MTIAEELAAARSTTHEFSGVGLNHLALITDDMDATVRFWHGVVGCDLVATLAVPDFKHYFFRLTDSSTIAFFEYAAAGDRERLRKPAGVFDRRACQFDHISFDVETEDDLQALADRLNAAGCETTEVVDHGLMKSVYFTDCNGIALEASVWVDDPTAGPADFSNPIHFADPDPVPAVIELQNGGLKSVPTTNLV